MLMVLCVTRRIQIVGLESYRNQKFAAEFGMLREHIRALRRIPGLESSTVWLIPESNLAGAGGMHVMAIEDLNNVNLMHEDTKLDVNGEKKVGFRTTEENKRFMALRTSEAFKHRRIRLYQQFVSIGGVAHNEIQKTFESELRFFYRFIFPAKDETFGRPKEKLSGKSRGKKDDMVLALLICHLMIFAFLREVRLYGKYLSGQT